jgi:hypothetical protein
MKDMKKPNRPKIRIRPETGIIIRIPKFNLFGVMNSISNYNLFRFWMIVLGILGWILFFIEYCS